MASLFQVLIGRTPKVEAHHAGLRGIGQKCSDHEAIPLTAAAHRHWHDCDGPFKGWTRSMRVAWAQEKILATQARAIKEGVLT